ncbi:MAG TPA: hypothetical protein GYA07_03630 [Verrucomicrobia bacterium]|nr:hypothetical protein [Verrucomicrobiota bacterium]HOP96845.1 hypothetical protein [Verrucomicrobiota bacterium]
MFRTSRIPALSSNWRRGRRQNPQAGTPVAGQQFEYGFDDIGNRQKLPF